jgi:hypothetical protein
MSTVKWAKEHAGVQTFEVRKAANKVADVIEAAKDTDGDERLDEFEMKKALKNEPPAVWSAVMGTFASTQGVEHSDQLSRKSLYETLFVARTDLYNADTNEDRTYSADELRALKNRMPERLVELAKALGS